jgi:uncharacterized membrane protein YdfJ with MMPL/SSD domain
MDSRHVASGASTLMARIARTMIRYRFLVFGTWVALILGSLVATQNLSSLWTDRSTLPGTESERASQILERHLGQKPFGSFILVAQGVPGAELEPSLRAAADRAAKVLPGGRVTQVVQDAAGVASATVVSPLEPAKAGDYTDDVRAAAGSIPGARLYVTGEAAVTSDLDPVFAHDLEVGELYIAVPIALAILVAIFGTLSFLVPFAFAFAAIPVTLAVVWLFAHVMEMQNTVENLVTLIGLGIAVDYSLLTIHRFREERLAGGDRTSQVVRTMETAGRAVLFSGSAVAIGLALLVLMPVPVIRGYGVAGFVVPLVSMLATLTLMPAMLYSWAPHLDRVRVLPRRFVDFGKGGEEGFWRALARSIMRRPRLFAAGAAALLVAVAVPAFSLQVTPGTNEGLPQHLESVQGLNVLSVASGEGSLAPSDIVVDAGTPGSVRRPKVQAAVGRLVTGLRADPEVAKVYAGQIETDATGRYLHLQAAGVHEYGSQEAQSFVDRLRGDIIPAAGFPRGVEVLAGGGPAGGVDFLDKTYGAFPWLVLAVLGLTYLMLMRAFRSVFLPLKAILMNLLSIGAAYGVLVAAFRYGWGEPLGLVGADQIDGWIPVFLFAMLFGLSMDYEVFLVSRMREEWDAGGDNQRAVHAGLAKTGRLVTAAGAIMVAAFAGFVAGSFAGLQEFGLGLAAAILIDVTVVRAVLVPAVMKLMDRWNWWMPARVARVVRVKPSPLRPKPQVAVSASAK